MTRELGRTQEKNEEEEPEGRGTRRKGGREESTRKSWRKQRHEQVKHWRTVCE